MTTFYRITCKFGCGTVEVSPRYPRQSVIGSIGKCPACGKGQVFHSGSRIRVTDTAHDCLAQCFHAKGDTCACECGGHCHGLGFCDPSQHRSKLAVPA